ncbi:MAG: hypothetical protein HYY18_09620 [Planctomycetes bacterium]|nr:hypothetical protein [Planctomycetota bacterium]
MKRLWLMALAVSLAVSLAAAGCKRHRDPNGFDRPGPPKPVWSATTTSVLEGGKVSVILSLSKAADDPFAVDLTSSNTARATVPADVVFPAGTTSLPVTITTIADADTSNSAVLITATAGDFSDTLGVTLLEDDAMTGPAHGPVAFGLNAALLLGPGTDGIFQTADDVLRVVENVGVGAPVLTSVVVGAVTPGPHALPVVTGVGDAVLVLTDGPDLTLGTSDDTLVQVEDILTAPVVTASVAVGRMESSEARRPLMVGTRAVIAMRGADLLTNGDDQIVIVDGLGTATLTTSTLGTPGLAFEAPSIPVMIDGTALAIHGAGADFVFGSVDDTFLIVTGIGAVPALATVVVPSTVHTARMGRMVRVGPTTIAMLGCGGDGLPGTADDTILVVQSALTIPVGVIVPAVGPMATDVDSEPVATGGDAMLVPLKGADLLGFTADDTVALATALSTPVPPAPTALAAGNPAAGPHGRLAVLSSSDAVRYSTGADAALGTADDGLVLLTALTGAAASATFATGAAASHDLLPTSATSVAFVGEGADALDGTADDTCLEVSAIGGAPVLNSNAIGSFKVIGGPVLVPIAGDSVLAARTAGPDGSAGTADDLFGVAPIP